MTAHRLIATGALVFVVLALAPAVASAQGQCLAPERAGPLAASVVQTALPPGWKVVSARPRLRDLRVALVDPTGARRNLRLGSGSSGAFTTPDAEADLDGIPRDVAALLAGAASAAVPADAWVACPDRTKREDRTGLADGPFTVPRWLALVVAHFRMLLLFAGLGLVLYRSARWRQF